MNDNDSKPYLVVDMQSLDKLRKWLDKNDKVERITPPTAIIEALKWMDATLRRTFEDNESDNQYPSYAVRVIMRDAVRELLSLRVVQNDPSARFDPAQGVTLPEA